MRGIKMGMYSTFNSESIEITDLVGLKEYLNTWEEELSKIIKTQHARTNGNYEWMLKLTSNMLRKDEDGNDIFTFEDWTDLKLISYWYDIYLIFLNGVANYIEGDVYWDFENNDEAGYVIFEKKKCIIHTGQMKYDKWSPLVKIREPETIEIWGKFLALSELEK
jgi:hypothetical protein